MRFVGPGPPEFTYLGFYLKLQFWHAGQPRAINPLMFELSKPHFWKQHSNARKEMKKKRKRKDVMTETMSNQEL